MSNNLTENHFNFEANFYTEKRNNGILSGLVRKEKAVVNDLLNIENEEYILDAGCGDGDYSISIKDAGGIPFGVDISSLMIDKYLSLGFDGKVEDVSTMKLNNNFDKILCAGSLEFVSSPRKAIKNLCTHLKKNGIIVWLYPRYSGGGMLYKLYHLIFNKINIHLFSKSYIKDLASSNGLVIIDYKKPDFITGAVKMMNKLT